jgi:NAD(P)-dependent dehydrogenase (short-subunit alcohol dehydrogenase family)
MGIGEAIVWELAKAGARLALVSRSQVRNLDIPPTAAVRIAERLWMNNRIN